MPNPEHLAKLRKDVKAWNRWRDENPNVTPDLRGAKLNGASLGKANLFQADMRSAELREAELRSANLRESDLGKAELVNADLSGANLTAASLVGASLMGVLFCGAELDDADFGEDTCSYTMFLDVDLSSVDRRRARIRLFRDTPRDAHSPILPSV